MKKWFNDFKAVAVVVLILPAMVMSAANTPQKQKASKLDEEVLKLKKELKLDDKQTAQVRGILEKDREQAVRDREMFKTDAMNLIGAAQDRRSEVNLQVSKLLDDTQKETFGKMRKMTLFDRELFNLTEGLLLDDDQAFAVEGILIDFYNRLEEMMPEGMRVSGGEGRGGDRGGSMDMGRVRGMMRDMQYQKQTKIKKVLSNVQKKLYKQILKDQRQRQKERRKQWKKMRRF